MKCFTFSFREIERAIRGSRLQGISDLVESRVRETQREGRWKDLTNCSDAHFASIVDDVIKGFLLGLLKSRRPENFGSESRFIVHLSSQTITEVKGNNVWRDEN